MAGPFGFGTTEDRSGTRSTIEAKVEALKARKQVLVAGILGASRGRALAVTGTELDDLFAPAGG